VGDRRKVNKGGRGSRCSKRGEGRESMTGNVRGQRKRGMKKEETGRKRELYGGGGAAVVTTSRGCKRIQKA